MIGSPQLDLDACEPVTLADLNAVAALLTRVDRKYVLTTPAADAFAAGLPAGVRILEIDGRRTFRYASTYFDTERLTCYLDTAHRRRKRFKVRSRTYLDSGARFLEVKTRRGSATVKRRTPWPDSGPGLAAAGMSFIGDTLAEDRIRLTGALRPTLRVTYVRSTFLLPQGSGRATIDSGLRWVDLRSGVEFAVPGLSIVETKSGSGPSAADRLLWQSGHRPAAVSKYATGLAALRPELPRNRWHRLLRSAPFLGPG
nr:polyphosphate polymerase domain-containing protein [Propionibacterium sp.]